ALHPSGTGPYKYDRIVPHQRLELVPNTNYWDKDRIAQQDRLVLIPMPEASTRTARAVDGAGRLDRGAVPGRDRGTARGCRLCRRSADDGLERPARRLPRRC